MANREKLRQAMLSATGPLLTEKGYISYIDALLAINRLSKQDYENWRFGKVPYLEKVINLNLAQSNFLLKELRKNCQKGNLQPSQTVYKSWGKGKKRQLKFSKSGTAHMEKLYSTHYLKPKDK